MGDLSPYKVGAHQHVPEIKQATGAPLAVVHADPGADAARHPGHRHRQADRRAGDPRAVLAAAYAGEPFVRVLPTGVWPHTAATAGANACHLQATVDVDGGRVIVVSALDNLGKGAAGQAVQNANLMLGLPETTGLLARTESAPVSVTAPKGFRAAGVAAGLKSSGGARRRLVVNDGPDAGVAGVFTANRVKAAPVLWSQQVREGRRGPRGRAQLGRRQRLHRPARLPGHPRHRRADRVRRQRRPAADRRQRGRGLLDRPDRRAAADGQARCRASARRSAGWPATAVRPRPRRS